MTNSIVVQKLNFTKKRIETLRDRLSEIRNTKIVRNRNGFKAGQFFFNAAFCVFDDSSSLSSTRRMDFLRDYLATEFNDESNEYYLEYHLQNVDNVIFPYFRELVNGIFEPDDEVLECDINGLQMVIETIDSVIDAINAEDMDIDPEENICDCIDCDCID